jgi:hypothetical protein
VKFATSENFFCQKYHDYIEQHVEIRSPSVDGVVVP